MVERDLFGSDISEITGLEPGGIGKTMIIDRLSHHTEILQTVSHFITYVKIGWGLPFVMNKTILLQRLNDIKAMGLGVSNGGTFLETCSMKGKFEKGLKSIIEAGFTHIEVSEGLYELTRREKKMAMETAMSSNVKLVMEVGKKGRENQLSLIDTIYKIQESMDYSPETIILEGRENGRDVGIYDHEGNIKWDWVEKILETVNLESLMFEAPLEKQQTELITRLGRGVNLGNVQISSAASLTAQRFGLAGEGLFINEQARECNGSPATKFVYHVIRNAISADQTSLMNITGLNRRTVQNAISDLIEMKLIKEVYDPRDMRRKTYSCLNHG